MRVPMWTCLLGLAMAVAAGAAAGAAPLRVVNVGSDITCVFNVTCYVTVTDSTGVFPPKPGYSGKPKLVTRTFYGASGAQGDGQTAYLYRVDFTKATAATDINCAIDVTLNFGAITRLNYDGSGPADVFVITSGGVGSVGLASAAKVGNKVTLTFATPICPKNGAAAGMSSFWIGMAALPLPSGDKAKVNLTFGGGAVLVRARMPDFQP